ncbi:MAG TPA: VWA domain-containing protein [Edaphobacter sp.]|jgi:VWFA-related protein|nr:VWA domain-containing protein [Edaphobacter sp.]
MQRSLHSLLLLLIGASSGAQQAPSNPSSPTDSGITLRTGTNLVVVDVVVTDKNNKPVHDLKVSDFTIQENGLPQQIRNFEEHTAPSVVRNVASPPKLPQGVFTNFTPIPQTSGPLNIILFDTLNTPTADQAYVHAQILKFLRDSHPGASFAIFALTNSHLVLLQSFTADPELLRAAVNSKKSRGNSLIIENPQTSDKPESQSEILEEHAAADPREAAAIKGVLEKLKQTEAETTTFELEMRAKYTLNAMSQLARYLSNFSGRKNLIWFSGSFPVSVMPDPTVHNPFAAVANSEPEFRRTTSLLSRSQVAVYPVSAEGLVNQQMSLTTAPGLGAPRTVQKYQNQQFSDAVDQHATMLDMAYQTGGKAFVNDNDFSGAVDDAIAAGAHYYTLTYTPTNNNADGRFRNIQVHLPLQKGYDLSYRHGYYADSVNDTPATPPPDTVHLAMMHGAPEPAQIVFKARVLPTVPATAPNEANLIAGTAAGTNASKSRGPYRSYAIDCAVISRSISFATANGLHSATLELMTIAYNENGVLITSTRSEARIDLPDEEYARFLRGSLPLHQQISVPAKGTFYLRIGIYNKTNDTVGAIEVPVSIVKDLPSDMYSSALPPTEPDSQ